MPKNRVTIDDLADQIVSEHYFTAYEGCAQAILNGRAMEDGEALDIPESFKHVTICTILTRNGTKLVGVNEGPVCAHNFNAEEGRRTAREKAIEQLWPMLGYEMRNKLTCQAKARGNDQEV